MPDIYSDTHFFSIPEFELNRLSIVSVGHFKAEAPFLCERPNGWKQPELVLITSGNGYAKVGSESWTIEPGSVIVLPHDTAYEFGVQKMGERLEGKWIAFAGEWVDGLWYILGLTDVHHVANAGSISLLLNDIIKIAVNQGDQGAHECTALLWCLLAELEKINNNVTGFKSSPKDWIVMAQEYAENNLHKNIGLEDLARAVNKSSYHFARKFKDRTGFSPISFLRTLRLNKAKEFLIQSDFNINEIGQRVGYPSPQHFSQVFKREIGMSPRAYAKQYAS
ncbi:MAG: hypothetical protein COA79_04335 [Planctomycetota bacterium]|nr:MAG: hypothetical protein COA79_04335 [Planctomycetota bacterium]